MGWDKIRTRRLKALWAAKKSIRQIARLLTLTPSQVSGKLHRLGLTDGDRKGERAEVRARLHRSVHAKGCARRRQANAEMAT